MRKWEERERGTHGVIVALLPTLTLLSFFRSPKELIERRTIALVEIACFAYKKDGKIAVNKFWYCAASRT